MIRRRHHKWPPPFITVPDAGHGTGATGWEPIMGGGADLAFSDGGGGADEIRGDFGGDDGCGGVDSIFDELGAAAVAAGCAI